MSINYYLNRFLFYLTPFVLAVLLYLYGSDARNFDYIYISALCLSCLFCWADKDTLGTLLILLGYWVGSEVLFAIADTPLYWFLTYSVCIGLSVYYFKQVFAKILLVIVLFSAGVEWYWWNIEYENKPILIYQTGLMALTVWMRQLLFYRALFMFNYFGHTAGKLALDGHVISIFNAYYVLLNLMIIEYFVRHLGGFRQMLVIYDLYSPVSILLSACTLAVVYMHYFYNKSQKHVSI